MKVELAEKGEKRKMGLSFARGRAMLDTTGAIYGLRGKDGGGG